MDTAPRSFSSFNFVVPQSTALRPLSQQLCLSLGQCEQKPQRYEPLSYFSWELGKGQWLIKVGKGGQIVVKSSSKTERCPQVSSGPESKMWLRAEDKSSLSSLPFSPLSLYPQTWPTMGQEPLGSFPSSLKKLCVHPVVIYPEHCSALPIQSGFVLPLHL